jgi:putative DNA primase/helicase
MKTPNTAKKANAEVLDTDNESIAQTGESVTTKVVSQPSQDPTDSNFGTLLLDMEATIQASPGQIIADGTIHRFDVDAVGDKKGWYVCHFTEEISHAVYGDWSEGETYRWHSLKDTVITPAQTQKLKSAMSEAKKARNDARVIEQSEAAKKCKELWDALDGASNEHPYLQNKNVKAYGIKIHPSDNGLIIPVRIEGTISSLQGIDESGVKNFRPNGKVSGGYHLIGDIGPLALICEGYATGASLHEATGLPTIVAFNAGNLPKVAKELKKAHPDTSYIVCADNDKWSDKNPGLTKAKEAAEVLGGIVAYPRFKKPDIEKYGKLSDWNDYHQRYGLKAVHSALKPKIKKTKRRRSLFTDLAELTKNISPPDFLIDGIVELDTVGALIGASSVGKSFMAVDMACSVASGAKFADRDVQQGSVLYLTGEGQEGILRRFAGWMQNSGISIAEGNIQISNTTISLDADGASRLLTATDNMDQSIKFLVVDTLARHMIGEENSNSDMGAFIAAVDKIREEHGCAALIVHHTGHSTDKSNRARGASAFYAALDFEFLLTGNKNGSGTIQGTKNREGPLYPMRSFSLVPIELDEIKQDNGEPVTTAVVEWGDFIPETSPSDTANGTTAAYQSLKGALISIGDYSQITLEDWREYAYRNSTCSGNDSKRSELNRFKMKLIKDGIIEVTGKHCRVLDPELIELGVLKETSDQELDD